MTSSTTPFPRRRFLSGALVATGAAVASTLVMPSLARAVTPALTFSDIPGTGDVKVVNYALALEDLEADLYAQALMRLTRGGKNKLGTAIPGLGAHKNADDVQYVEEFGVVEAQHRDLLRKTLGSAAITQFKYNFGMESLSRRGVVELLYTAENLGVGAYLGAITFFATKTYLQIAGAILGTEARHTAVIAQVLNSDFAGENKQVAPLFNVNHGIDAPVTPNNVLAMVSPFIVTS